MSTELSPSELSPPELPPRELSPREREVLERAAFGRSNNQIAAELGVTINTVKFHLASIFRKLGVENRTAAAIAFVRMAPRDEERLAP
jgi:DNA-binding NarL/FixJ family response regulator